MKVIEIKEQKEVNGRIIRLLFGDGIYQVVAFERGKVVSSLRPSGESEAYQNFNKDWWNVGFSPLGEVRG